MVDLRLSQVFDFWNRVLPLGRVWISVINPEQNPMANFGLDTSKFKIDERDAPEWPEDVLRSVGLIHNETRFRSALISNRICLTSVSGHQLTPPFFSGADLAPVVFFPNFDPLLNREALRLRADTS